MAVQTIVETDVQDILNYLDEELGREAMMSALLPLLP
jgi:hypothetical protein